uniref:Oxidation resistance protein 1 n=1 Tax=Neobodo designis TaxID=312471 RepID=A0A7S1QZW7_NEODS|mmetsp:Transcript_55071/g.169672  ORF Transcript_55071/g.169672 Transcript_55071/m.169672 type:complete len:379 (+) Transcript_55071:49-1185(+)
MGQLLNRCTDPTQATDGDSQRPAAHGAPRHHLTVGTSSDDTASPATPAPPPPVRPAPSGSPSRASLAAKPLRIDMGHTGAIEASEADLILAGALREKIRAALPPTQQHHWKLLYSSRIHGKNFTQMIKRTRKRGPTLIVVHEGKSEFGDSGRVFGGYANDEWRLVSDREHDAKANAAARVRAERCEAEGVETAETYSTRPEGQARQFFGSVDNFIFTSGDLAVSRPTAGHWRDAFDSNQIRIYRPKCERSSTGAGNTNFLYLMDTHPQSDRVGIGMGSDRDEGVGEFAWFLNRYLSAGRCCSRLCPTYGNPRLTSASEFGIAEVEVYGVDGDAIDEDGLADDLGEEDHRTLAERHAVDKALLELHGAKFYSDEPREEC